MYVVHCLKTLENVREHFRTMHRQFTFFHNNERQQYDFKLKSNENII